MDCYQPAGSFKIRGIGFLCAYEAANGALGFVSSSGGNAGLAVTYASHQLNLPCTIVVPSTTPQKVRQKMIEQGATVYEKGSVWDESDKFARAFSQQNSLAYVHPFDNPIIWKGHSTLIDELAEQGPQPEVIVCSVGGGGLLCGIMEGLDRHGWKSTKVVAVETHGAASLQASMDAKKLISIPAITSIAKTLGAKKVAAKAFEWTQTHPIHSIQVSDRRAVQACIDFYDRFQIFVEPSCGATLAAMSSNSPVIEESKHTVLVICGGNGVDSLLLSQWRNRFVDR